MIANLMGVMWYLIAGFLFLFFILHNFSLCAARAGTHCGFDLHFELFTFKE